MTKQTAAVAMTWTTIYWLCIRQHNFMVVATYLAYVRPPTWLGWHVQTITKFHSSHTYYLNTHTSTQHIYLQHRMATPICTADSWSKPLTAVQIAELQPEWDKDDKSNGLLPPDAPPTQALSRQNTMLCIKMHTNSRNHIISMSLPFQNSSKTSSPSTCTAPTCYQE